MAALPWLPTVVSELGGIARSAPSERDDWGNSADLRPHERANLHTMTLVEPCWNRHDVPAILSHYDDAITWHNMAMGEVYTGKEQVGAFLADLFAAVPDLTMHITRRLPRGDLVAEEYTIQGTHRGTLFGIPATGRPVTLHAVSFVEMRDAKLLEDHFYFDIAGVLRQLGLFPSLRVAETTLGHALMSIAVFARFPGRVLAGWRKPKNY